MTWEPRHVEPDQLWRDDKGNLFKVVRIYEKPCVLMEPVASPAGPRRQIVHEIGSTEFSTFQRLDPVVTDDGT